MGNEREIEMASQKSEIIAKINEENKKLSATREMQEMYLSEQMAIYDENTRISVATQKGEKKKQIEIAKKMLQKNMKIEEIEEITGLSKEEIIKITKIKNDELQEIKNSI